MLLSELSRRIRNFRGFGVVLRCAIAFSLCAPFQLRADFIHSYDATNFSLINTNADGSIDRTGAPSLITVIGANNGSGLPGTTDFDINRVVPGPVMFQFMFTSMDAPGFDFAGYLVNDMFHQLADTTGDSGAVALFVNSGESFGFRVGTLDNTGEPGILTISNFEAPQAAVPEPNAAPGLAVLTLIGILLRRALGNPGTPRKSAT